MKDYSLVKEEKDHFVIGHSKDGEFKVAKKGINKALQKKIQALPKGFSGKGSDPEEQEVSADDVARQDSGFSVNPDINYTDFMNVNQQNQPPPVAAPQAPSMGQNFTDDMTNLASASITGKPFQNPNMHNMNFEQLPLGQKEGEKSVVPAPEEAAPQPQQPQQTQVAQPNADYINSGYGKIESGIGAEVKANEKAQKQIAQTIAEHDLINQTQFQNYQQNVKDWQTEQDALQRDYANGSIDPKRVWHKMETPQKIGVGISILLSGISQGLIGGPNSAMQAIDKTIDRDIEAQKEDLGKKHNLLSMNLRKYGDINTAYQATKAQQLSSLQAELQQIAATTNNAQTKANAMKQYGDIELKKGQLGASVNQSKFWNDVASGRTPLSPTQINSIPDSHKYLKESAVVIPGQSKVYFTNDPKNAEIVNKATQSALELESTLKQLESFQKNTGTTYNPFSSASKEADRLQQELQLKLANYMELNGKSMTPDQRKDFSKTVENPGSFRSENAANSYKNVRKMINGTLNSTYQTYLPTYAAPQFKAQEMPAKASK